MIILSIESSCDETSVAIIKDGKNVLSNVVFSQIESHKKFGGVLPELASREHVENIDIVFEKAINEAKIKIEEIDLVAVTEGPGLIGSLLVGINAAKAFAYANDIKLLGVDHICGHIYSNAIEKDFSFPIMNLVVSGGHTELIYMEDHYKFTTISKTVDDAIGEAFDKVGRVLGLDYPGGPEIDKLSKLGNNTYKLTKKELNKDSINFSFSGIKSAVINLVNNSKQRKEEVNINDLCRSFQESVTDTLITKLRVACDSRKVTNIAVSGGVAANSMLRNKLTNNFKEFNLMFPKMKYCSDNAAMIGVAAYHAYVNRGKLEWVKINDFGMDGYSTKKVKGLNVE